MRDDWRSRRTFTIPWWRETSLLRQKIADIGLTPITSMFMRGEADRGSVSDFRPQIEDSEALSIRIGADIWLLRPLRNPKAIATFRWNGSDVERLWSSTGTKTIRTPYHVQDHSIRSRSRPRSGRLCLRSG
ncbi:glucan biosynthesis protein [Aurantimonas sp. HBX-1]|uniref:glucan biosynthesis protein n=1 Tax=Aurantimonas sp. HBX-1 TaxID=2906072 RepID=UPI00351D1755